MERFAACGGMVRGAYSDFAVLNGESDHAGKAQALFAAGTVLFVITRGARGAWAWHRHEGMIEVSAPLVEVVDTVGAGDSFQAALLFALRAMSRIGAGPLTRISAAELRRALTFAAACAAVTCSRPGADPPRLSEVGAAVAALTG